MRADVPKNRKVNINECFAGTANCHRNAVCNDLDPSANASSPFYDCVCPPGLVGDGVATCDLPQYQTQLVLEQPGTTVNEFDANAFKDMLYSSGAIPADVDPTRVFVTAEEPLGMGRRRMRRLLEEPSGDEEIVVRMHESEGQDGGTTRKLLQSGGIQITVTIYSESQSLMSNVTSAINTTALSGTGLLVTQAPTNYVNPYQVGCQDVNFCRRFHTHTHTHI